MGIIRRISATLSSSVDRAVSRVENHDAIVEAALRETQQAAARARVRLARVRKDGASLKTRRSALAQAGERWTERAKTVAATDEAKALECLRRKRECEAQMRTVTEAITRHEELEAKVSEQVKTIEQRIGEVTQQRNLMRSRQSVSEALSAIHSVDGVSHGDIEETFDRWEAHLGETELRVGLIEGGDLLEKTFAAEEDDAELRAELHALMAGQEQRS